MGKGLVLVVIVVILCLGFYKPQNEAPQTTQTGGTSIQVTKFDPNGQLVFNDTPHNLTVKNEVTVEGWETAAGAMVPAGFCLDYNPSETKIFGSFVTLKSSETESASALTIGKTDVPAGHSVSFYPITFDGLIEMDKLCSESLSRAHPIN